jgi:hypothetical protein
MWWLAFGGFARQAQPPLFFFLDSPLFLQIIGLSPMTELFLKNSIFDLVFYEAALSYYH